MYLCVDKHTFLRVFTSGKKNLGYVNKKLISGTLFIEAETVYWLVSGAAMVLENSLRSFIYRRVSTFSDFPRI